MHKQTSKSAVSKCLLFCRKVLACVYFLSTYLLIIKIVTKRIKNKIVMWTKLRNCSALVIGAGVGLAVYYRQRQQEAVVHASWTVSDKPVNPSAIWDKNWDCRSPTSLVKPIVNDSATEENRYNAEIEKARPKVTHHIILVRHGEYLDIGDKDETHRLTERGRLQAKYTGQRLHEYGINWDKIVASTMTRAQETCDIIMKELKDNKTCVNNCAFIREGAPIPPQPPVGHWRVENSQFFRDGARIEAGFRRYFHRAEPQEEKDKYTLIVCHANVIRYFICRALQFPPEAWLRFNINHGSITWLSIAPSGNVSCKYIGDTGYMPASVLTNRIPREVKNKSKTI